MMADASWMETMLLASVRMTAFVLIAPPFGHNAIPARIKAMLGLGLGLAVSTTLPPLAVAADDTAGFLLALVGEIVIGLSLGFLVMLAFAAVQAAGSLIDLFGGFQLAQGFDPQSMINGAQFTRFFHMAALALLFATDGYQLVLRGALQTFEAVPVGGMIDMGATAELIIAGLVQMFLAALQIAGPLLVVLFLADVGLGLLTRVAPAMNAFALGFPLKILITVVFSSIVFLALPRVVSSLVQDALELMQGAL